MCEEVFLSAHCIVSTGAIANGCFTERRTEEENAVAILNSFKVHLHVRFLRFMQIAEIKEIEYYNIVVTENAPKLQKESLSELEPVMWG